MRMMLKASMPVETGNAAAKSGTLGTTMKKILDDLKPEAAYFTDEGGMRTAFLFFDMKDSSEIPAVAEPWMLAFNASISFRPVMTTSDLIAGMPGMQKAVADYGK